ncbi:MAG: undecaprenyldiphospho-muramoylpentapeptide beta-N-acetylglucosaminyltransferase [Clostridia bacterium]|nr:undecaprenyldiphospho-muramoylpentapeptide beta-N-acetylglucosaminyltransferase [Clostridia bacterium]
MKIVFAGGGTAGHINPALAVAGYIKERIPEAEISYIGTERGLESRLVRAENYAFYPIDIRGFQRKLTVGNMKENVRNVYRVFKSSADAKKILRQLNPDVVVGTGGYVSGPVLRMAVKLGIKTAIHEQNAFPGVTSKMLAGSVDKVMLAMPEAEAYLKCKQAPVVTGNPVRGSLFRYSKEEAREILGLDHRPMVLSFGGSLGARPINEAVAGMLKWANHQNKCYFYHATGKAGFAHMQTLLREKEVDLSDDGIRLSEYIDNMDVLLPAADLVICRAGAITLSEIECCGKASILIPSPYVAENHQYHNAMTLVNKKAAAILEEKDLNDASLISKVQTMLEHPQILREMEQNARACAIADANKRIADVILSIV